MILTYFLNKPLLIFLKNNNLIQKNYLNKKIPIGYGLGIGIIIYIILFLGYIMDIYQRSIIFYLYFLLSMALLAGILDDFYRQDQENGFYGHFKSFIKESKVTSGCLKAVLISFAALIISFELSNNYLFNLIDFLLIVLGANFINLLDLRPGRAIKSFSTAGIITIFLRYESIILLLPLLVVILLLAPLDLKGKAMLGDTGSNLLGVFLGFTWALFLQIEYKIIITSLLILIHLYTERYSLTETIKNNSLLNYIDLLGR